MNSNMRGMLIIFCLGVVTAAAFAAFSSPIAGPDMVHYDRLGSNLAAGHGFSLSVDAPFLPSMYREPIYPLFLAVIYKTFGHRPVFAVFAQILLHAVTAVITYLIARHIFSTKAAFLSAALVAVFPTLANMTSYILCETLFTFELCLAVLLLFEALKRRAISYFVISAVVFALLTLTKTIVIFLPFVILAAVLIRRLSKRMEVRRFIICCVYFFIVYSALVSVWPMRNKAVFNTFSMASRGGMVIWSRAEKIDDSPREILATATCSISEYLANKLFPDIVVKSNRYFYKDLEREMQIEAECARQGMSPGDIDKKMAGEAFRKIAAHPFRYSGYTFIEWLKMAAFTYSPFLNEEGVGNYFSKIHNGPMILALLKGANRSIAYIMLLMVFAAMVKSIKAMDRWLILAVSMLYINLMYSLLDAIGRYAVPLIPLYCIMIASIFYRSPTNGLTGDPGA